MAKFKYVGVGNSAPLSTIVFGINFTRGGPAQEVKSQKFIDKLRNNPSFEEVIKTPQKDKEDTPNNQQTS